MLQALDDVLAHARGIVDAQAQGHLQSIRASVHDVLPRLLEDGAAPAGSNELHTVRETVLRYLPETLANYAALPPAFRSSHALQDGRTARQMLDEQLGLLATELQRVVANVARGDAQALLANGRFLEQKFRQPDFLAPR